MLEREREERAVSAVRFYVIECTLCRGVYILRVTTALVVILVLVSLRHMCWRTHEQGTHFVNLNHCF